MSEIAVAEAIEVNGEEHAAHYDPLGARIGMWLFLFTEVLLFGTLFLAFAVYLRMYRVDFIAGSRHLDKLLGAANTCILMTSSLTMALAVVALQRRNKRLCIAMLSVTLLFGVVFLGNKAQEWAHKFELDLYPKSETMLAHPQGEQIFFGMYYAMTGLHALHIIIGGIAIATALVFVLKGRIRPERAVMIENVGLYWHLVDVIWIFLFPMFYLIS